MAEQEKKPGEQKKPEKKKPPAGGVGGVTFPFFEVVLGIVVIGALAPLVGTFLFSGTGTGISELLASLLSYAKVTATVIAMLGLVVIVYANIRIQELSREESQKFNLALNWNVEKTQKSKRWERVDQYMSSLNASDWRIAILEADNILDEVIERMGYKGETLGERMKHIEASEFPYLDEAWQAHKMRNAIAHKGTDYEISRSDAEQTINIYYRIFKELGYL